MIKLKLPKNKKFIFTIIDDTDDAFYNKIKPVYNILIENGLKTTKTIWVYPVRDNNISKGDCLENIDYKNFILKLKRKGFEIALHNVGSGNYDRNEIIKGLKKFKNIFGEYPKIHVNHSYNKDNIYCGSKRFSFPFNLIVKYLYPNYKNFFGEISNSQHFWGDLHKKHIKYSRNYEIDNINTYKINPYMPYLDKKYEKYSNYWYSSSFAPNQLIFKRLVTKKSIDKLEKEGGVCILYTHLGYYYKNGKVDQNFVDTIKYIGKKKSGLFLPVSKVLDILNENNKKNKISNYLPRFKKFKLELLSLLTRIKYRYIYKLDDFNFKKTDLYND